MLSENQAGSRKNQSDCIKSLKCLRIIHNTCSNEEDVDVDDDHNNNEDNVYNRQIIKLILDLTFTTVTLRVYHHTSSGK